MSIRIQGSGISITPPLEIRPVEDQGMGIECVCITALPQSALMLCARRKPSKTRCAFAQAVLTVVSNPEPILLATPQYRALAWQPSASDTISLNDT